MSDRPDNHEQAAGPPTAPGESVRDSSAEKSPSLRTRRRLFKAALAAVPVVMTLRGRPAQADMRWVSHDRDPYFFVTGHGLSHEFDEEPGPEGQAQTQSWLDGNSQSSRWSTGSESSWSSDGIDGGSESDGSSTE